MCALKPTVVKTVHDNTKKIHVARQHYSSDDDDTGIPPTLRLHAWKKNQNDTNCVPKSFSVSAENYCFFNSPQKSQKQLMILCFVLFDNTRSEINK